MHNGASLLSQYDIHCNIESNRPKLNGSQYAFKWKAFVFMRPDDSEDEQSNWTLATWAHNLKTQLMRFAQWTRKNKQVYADYTYKFSIGIKTLPKVRYLADQLTDEHVVQVIRSMYSISKDEVLESSKSKGTLHHIFFGPHVNECHYIERIENAWGESDEGADTSDNEE